MHTLDHACDAKAAQCTITVTTSIKCSPPLHVCCHESTELNVQLICIPLRPYIQLSYSSLSLQERQDGIRSRSFRIFKDEKYSLRIQYPSPGQGPAHIRYIRHIRYVPLPLPLLLLSPTLILPLTSLLILPASWYEYSNTG